MFTVKDLAAALQTSEYTIRFYAKEDLFPFVTRDKNNVRLFTENDLWVGKMVMCLRNTGMPLKEIKHFLELCKQGEATYHEQLAIIQKQKIVAEQRLKEMEQQLEHIKEKESHYKALLNIQNESI